MPRRYYRRRYYRSGKSKYSNETSSFISNDLAVSAGTTFPSTDSPRTKGVTIVDKTLVAGTRKAKNFDISLTTNNLLGADRNLLQ